MPKRIVICFDGTWNTPADRFVGLKKLHGWMDALRGQGPDRLQEALEAVDPGPDAVETNVCRFYRPVRRAAFGQEHVDETVQFRLRQDVGYRPKNPGLHDA